MWWKVTFRSSTSCWITFAKCLKMLFNYPVTNWQVGVQWNPEGLHVCVCVCVCERERERETERERAGGRERDSPPFLFGFGTCLSIFFKYCMWLVGVKEIIFKQISFKPPQHNILRNILDVTKQSSEWLLPSPSKQNQQWKRNPVRWVRI